MHIVVVCGTNRDGALSRLLATEVAESYRQRGQSVDLLDMNELPPEALLPTAYKEQADSVKKVVDRFLASDGAVFVIPEYNGSYPGVVKLFVDMLPYPEGFDSRPCAFIGLAAGQFKSLRAVEHFQQVAGYRNAYMYPRRDFHRRQLQAVRGWKAVRRRAEQTTSLAGRRLYRVCSEHQESAMIEDFEGSRTEFMKMLAEHDAPPAYVLRAQRVEQVCVSLLKHCHTVRHEMLELVATRLGMLAMQIDQHWDVLLTHVQNPEVVPKLEALHEDLQPKVRVPLEPTTSARRIRSALKDLIGSLERFNRRWQKFVDGVDLSTVNYERQQYNDCYLVEKSAALGSDKLAEMGFERLEDCTTVDILAELPCIEVPVLN